MKFIHHLAHAESQHTETTSELVHNLTQPEVALPLYILMNVALYYALKNTKRKTWILPIYMGTNLIIGILLFSLVPLVSVIAISTGIIGALAVSFILIANG